MNLLRYVLSLIRAERRFRGQMSIKPGSRHVVVTHVRVIVPRDCE